MAVTILTSPAAITPSDNPIRWTFDSTQSAQANFAFLVKVFVNGVNVGNHLKFPEYGGNRGQYDAEDDCRIRCGVPNMDSGVFATAANNTGEIYIEVYDYYSNPSTDPPEIQGSAATSSTVVFFKACLTDRGFLNWDPSDYAMNPGSLWLTEFPRDQRLLCKATESIFLMFITNGDDCAVEISLYDENGGIISSDNPSISSTGIPIMILNLSQANLLANTVFSPANLANTAYFTVAISNTSLELSEVLTIHVDDRCDKYGTKRLHFLSRIGAIDAFDFTLANKETADVQRSQYERQFGDFSESGTYEYSLTNGRQNHYITTAKSKMTINSDFIAEELQNWLVREIYETPFCTMEQDDEFVRVLVLNGQYEVKKYATDSLFNEIIELGLTDTRKSALI